MSNGVVNIDKLRVKNLEGSTIQFRSETAANWAAANPILASGEPGFETDTGKQKIGDGATAWNDLDYQGGDSGPITADQITDATEAGVAMLTAEDAEAQAALLGDFLSGGGVGDTDSYIVAQPGDDVAAKYAEAKALTPNNTALSSTNRAALVLMPGVYTLTAELAVDTNYVDVIGLGAGEFTPAVEFAGNTINVTAWDIRVVGISVGTQGFKVSGRPNITGVTGTASNNRITIANHGLRVGDVISFSSLTGGTGLSTGVRYLVTHTSADWFTITNEATKVWNSGYFTTDITAGTLVVQANGSQRFDICTGGGSSFGSESTASGTFTNCTGGGSSFAFGGTASGIFINCTGGVGSFGPMGSASGTFTNCTGGIDSFGGSGTASGTFTNCKGGSVSFGGFGTASGTFTNCTGGDAAFGGVYGTASGTFTNCTGGNYAFGGDGTASGTFTNCTGGDVAFGFGGTLSGKLYYCRLTSGTFQSVAPSGITRYCVDGNNVVNNQG